MSVRIIPNRKYFLREILNMKLVPSVGSYDLLYNRVTVNPIIDGVRSSRRVRPETNHEGMKAGHNGQIWNKIQGRIWVMGEDIIKFNKLNEEFGKISL